MSNRHFVVTHKIKEIKGGTHSYEQWNEKHPSKKQKGKLGDKFDLIAEDIRANPDSLREDEAMYAHGGPTTPQMLMGEAILHLQGRQKEVYLLTMREGKSLAETAEVLGIAKGTAQKFRERAIKFISAYCQEAITKGRV